MGGIDYEILSLGMTDADAHHNQFLGLDIYEFFPLIQAPPKSGDNSENDEGTVESEIVVEGNVNTKKRPLHISASKCINFTSPPFNITLALATRSKKRKLPYSR
jgi:hypothetical protein